MTTPTTSISPGTLAHTLKLAWPLIAANITVPLLGLADTAIAGRLESPAHLAAIALGSSWIAMLFWSFSFLRQAVGGMTAQATGAGQTDDISRLLLQSGGLALGLGVAITLFAPSIVGFGLSISQLDPELLALTREYLSIRWFGAPAMLLIYVCHGWLIGRADTGKVLTLLVCMNLLNIALNALLGLGLGLGVRGIALGTVISEWLAALGGLALIAQHAQQRGFRIDWRQARLAGLRRLLTANGFIMVRSFCLLSVFLVFNTLAAQLGAATAAASALLLTLLTVVAFALDGFADVAEAQVGQAVGAADHERLHRAIRSTGWLSFGFAVLASVTLWLGQNLWIAALTTVPETIEVSRTLMPWLVFLPLVAWISMWLDGVLIGLNAFKTMAAAMLAGAALGFAPIVYVTGDTAAGLWLAFWAFHSVRSIANAIGAWRIRRGYLLAAS